MPALLFKGCLVVRTACAVLFVLLLGQSVHAQSRKISGYVEDAATGERLAGANVYDPVSLKGTATNSYGFFQLAMPKQVPALVISFAGYRSVRLELKGLSDTLVTVKLSADLMLDELIVEAERGRSIEKRTEMSVITLPAARLRQIPAIAGETDVIKALQLMPGVQRGSEGSAGFFVRGGSPDQNLVLLDGVPVYNANHLFGFFSVFNSDAIRNVSMLKGGFPARYGGRLSSVLEIDLKEGNNQKFGGTASVGLIASRFMLEGPTVKNKGSFLISGRRTYADQLSMPLQQMENTSNQYSRTRYYFYDLTAKVNHAFGKRDHLFISGYTGRDVFNHLGHFKSVFNNEMSTTTFRQRDYSDLGWGNATASARWTHLFSDRWFVVSRVYATDFGFHMASENSSMEHQKGRIPLPFPSRDTRPVDTTITQFASMRNTSGVRDLSAATTFERVAAPGWATRFGVQHIWHTYRPEATQVTSKSESDRQPVDQAFRSWEPIRAAETGVFIEQEMKAGERISLHAGLRGSRFESLGSTFYGLEPRLSMRAELPGAQALKFSYTYMRQYVHLLTNVSVSMPTDLWIPSGNGVLPQSGYQFGAGYARPLQQGAWELSLETYYKRMSSQIEYKPGAQFVAGSEPLYNQIETGGRGWAYGAEVMAEKKTGRLTGWIGYTWAHSRRQFETLNRGEPFPFKFDRRHDLSLVWNYALRKGVTLNATWVYSSGMALTLPRKKYLPALPLFGSNSNFDQDFVIHYGERNSFRAPAYHRLDIGAQFTKKKKNGVRTWNVGAYNAYSRMNPFYVYADVSSDGTTVRQINLFPIIPGFSYTYAF